MKKTRSVRDYLKKPYARILIPSEDGTYSAELLEFPGCFAQGDTAQQAMQNLDEAAVVWIEAAIEQRQDIPEPLSTFGHSGKISLRIPRSIHKKAAQFARKDDVSLNQFFASAIAARVGAEEICDRLFEKLQGRLALTACTLQIQQVTEMRLFAGSTQPLSSAAYPGIHIDSVGPVATVGELQPVKAIPNA